MTPQEKNVFGKLFTKTELGTHKIDLAAIDDINKILDGALAKQRSLIAQGIGRESDQSNAIVTNTNEPRTITNTRG